MIFFTLSNTLTLIRLILSPLSLPFLLAYLLPLNIFWINSALALLFIAFSLTDYFDGYFARRYNQVTQLGKLLDPIADKFLMYSTLIGLLAAHKIYFYWVVILIGRELFVMSLRLIAVENKFEVPVSFLAKIKTAVISLCITYIIYNPYHEMGMSAMGANCIEWGLLGLSMGLTLYTAKQYFSQFLINYNNRSWRVPSAEHPE